MRPLDPADLLRPRRLLRTMRPWAALAYLLAETLAGWLTLALIPTVLLVPVWVLAWPRLEERLVRWAGRPRPVTARARWEMRWTDWVLTALSICAAVVGLVCATAVTALLLFPLWQIARGVRRDAVPGDEGIPEALGTASLVLGYGILFAVGLALVLWTACAAAYGWGLLTSTLLRDDRRRLANQVSALSERGVQHEDQLLLERRQLERDLHDGAQMHLGAAGMRLALLQLEVESLEPGPERDALLVGIGDVRDRLEDATGAVRGAARGLVPASLRDGGLDAALTDLADALPLEATVECSVPRLDAHCEMGLFLIASEALTNVVRHAQASRVDLLVVRTGEPVAAPGARNAAPGTEILLEISDDGRGGAQPTGTGMVSMASRARILGGSLTCESPVGGPTRIRVSVPAGEVGKEGA